MTEEGWWDCAEPKSMLEFAQAKISERKLRLFAVACCRSAWNGFRYQDTPRFNSLSHHIIEVAEQYAEGLVGEDTRSAAEQAALVLYVEYDDDVDPPGPCLFHIVSRAYTIQEASYCAASTGKFLNWNAAESDVYPFCNTFSIHSELMADVSHILRDIVGNPFRPITFNSRWLTSNVAALARGIYHDRRAELLPVLADALMDAGCDDPDVLSHCRHSGPHVRGCWVVDLLLGRS